MISVCVATYNGAHYVLAQLQSILPQLAADDELIVSDDGSTDATREVVQCIGDSRIVLIDGPCAGLIRNFEHALRQAHGDIIFLCDQDDIWLPGKIEHCVAALHSHLLVVTDCKVVDGDLNEIAPSFFRLRNSGGGLLHNLWKNSYLGCCMAFRRELLDYALPFPASIPMHDMWLGMIAETRGTVSFLPIPLSLYRRHACNASYGWRSSASIWKMLTDRVLLGALVAGRTVVNTFVKARR